jgi:hypothetical protein
MNHWTWFPDLSPGDRSWLYSPRVNVAWFSCHNVAWSVRELGCELDDHRIVFPFPAGAKDFSALQPDQAGSAPPPQPLTQSAQRVFQPDISARDVNLTAHLHPMSRLEMSGALPPVPNNALMTCTKTPSHVDYICVIKITHEAALRSYETVWVKFEALSICTLLFPVTSVCWRKDCNTCGITYCEH